MGFLIHTLELRSFPICLYREAIHLRVGGAIRTHKHNDHYPIGNCTMGVYLHYLASTMHVATLYNFLVCGSLACYYYSLSRKKN